MPEYGASRGPRVGRGIKVAFLFVVLAATLLALEVLGPNSAGAVGNIEGLDSHQHEPDVDNRVGSVAPTSAQQDAVRGLDGNPTVRWNDFGTPQSLINHDGFLERGVQGGDAGSAARRFLADNAAVFGVSGGYLGGSDTLEEVNVTPMGATDNGGESFAVFFRQKFGNLDAAQDGSITVGLTRTAAGGWNVVYVSSSLSKDRSLAVRGTNLSAEEAWRTAAQAVGDNFSAADVTPVAEQDIKEGEDAVGFDKLEVEGLPEEQNVRLTAVPTPEGGVRPAYEALLLEEHGGEAEAFTSFVDANSGKVLVRINNVQQFADDTGIEYAQADPPPAPVGSEPFTGQFSPTSCEEPAQNGPFAVAEGTGSVAVYADATNKANDIVLQLLFEGRESANVVAEQDTGTTPEGILYEPAGGVPAGDYFVRVCSFENGAVLPPDTYTGFFATNEAVDPPEDATAYPPKWNYFFDNPIIGVGFLQEGGYPNTDSRQVDCWNTQGRGNPGPNVEDCDHDAANRASRIPWDANPKAANDAPTFTTIGNNARSAESWYSAFAPGPTGFRPVSETRDYNFEWSNDWHDSTNPTDPGEGCSPTELTTPGEGNDISAATAALFATHNRIHDWSYHRGFTERAYNLQDSNFGLTDPDRENDPELGDVQAGAVNGGAPSYIGRDNANQITFNDGIAPITNMYLWQPIAGAFYAPCVDGDYDVSVIAHEYGHAIQNRMVAGPDAQLSGLQARSMGESWSDLTAIEYMYEYGYQPGSGANRYAVGPYVTGDKQAGIRNYGMNQSPLNYSNIEYDPVGTTSPHADGEIWSATNFGIRQLLMRKYEDQYPSAPGTNLQMDCADGRTPSSECPGNVRWTDILHRAFLLQPSAVSFVDARDAYLAADRLLYPNNSNQRELWLAFARRGLGEGASSMGTNDRNPVPSFASPQEDNAEVTFEATTPAGRPVDDYKVYVGDYEARAVPVADGDSSTARPKAATLAPGTYNLVVQAPGYGLFRTEQTFRSGQTGRSEVTLRPNLASVENGAEPTATSDGTSGDGGSSAVQLLDDTEGTNWRADGPVAGKQVTVDLAGGTRVVERVRVSAFLRPQEQSNRFGDTDTQSRFSALRQFEILTCTATASNDCSNPNQGFTSVYTSPEDAASGPAAAGTPRPTAPDLKFATYNVRDGDATHVQLRVISNQCTGGAAYQGDPDADPANNSDCSSQSPQAEIVRAAELEVFGR